MNSSKEKVSEETIKMLCYQLWIRGASVALMEKILKISIKFKDGSGLSSLPNDIYNGNFDILPYNPDDDIETWGMEYLKKFQTI